MSEIVFSTKAKTKTKDEILPDKSIIYWSRERIYCTGHDNKLYVQCGHCKKIRIVRQPSFSRMRKRKSGACKKCGDKIRIQRMRSNRKSNTIINGYKAKSLNLYTLDEQKILYPMCIIKSEKYNNAHRVLEHRAVAALRLNRPLRKDEIVHHMNGNKTDNRPENLEVLTVSEHHAGFDSKATFEYRIQILEEYILKAGLPLPK